MNSHNDKLTKILSDLQYYDQLQATGNGVDEATGTCIPCGRRIKSIYRYKNIEMPQPNGLPPKKVPVRKGINRTFVIKHFMKVHKFWADQCLLSKC